jgi:Transposase DDE domain
MPRRQRRKNRCWDPQRSLRNVLQDFLTPALWKQANKARQLWRRQRSYRWTTQPLVLVLLFMSWCAGDSQAERFEVAKGYCQVAWMAKRRKPGGTVEGFQKALARLPMQVLRGLAAGVRTYLDKRLKDLNRCHGFIPIGCDGSRVTIPRTAELEERVGAAGNDRSAPSIWVTALVYLRTGVPLAWRFGLSDASERSHLLQMIALLPKAALLVTDAGYVGYQLAKRLKNSPVSFLLRLCSTVTLRRLDRQPLKRYREGIVYYFPSEQDAKKGDHPLTLRLICIRGRRKRNDVWLLTNVMDRERLSVEWAGHFYSWRWQNEGCFRNYKSTMKKVKLTSHTVRLVHREAEGSWLSMQLLLAQGILSQKKRAIVLREKAKKHPADQPRKTKKTAKAEEIPAALSPTDASLYSPRKILIAIRAEMTCTRQHGGPAYAQRVADATGEERSRRVSAKASREWPRRKPHRSPKPPMLLKLTAKQKALISRLERTTA